MKRRSELNQGKRLDLKIKGVGEPRVVVVVDLSDRIQRRRRSWSGEDNEESGQERRKPITKRSVLCVVDDGIRIGNQMEMKESNQIEVKELR